MEVIKVFQYIFLYTSLICIEIQIAQITQTNNTIIFRGSGVVVFLIFSLSDKKYRVNHRYEQLLHAIFSYNIANCTVRTEDDVDRADFNIF